MDPICQFGWITKQEFNTKVSSKQKWRWKRCIDSELLVPVQQVSNSKYGEFRTCHIKSELYPMLITLHYKYRNLHRNSLLISVGHLPTQPARVLPRTEPINRIFDDSTVTVQKQRPSMLNSTIGIWSIISSYFTPYHALFVQYTVWKQLYDICEYAIAIFLSNI